MTATNVARAGKRGNICVGNNVSVTMCPRLPGPLCVFWLLSHVKRLRAAYVTSVFHRAFTRFTFTWLVRSNITNTTRKTLSDRFL